MSEQAVGNKISWRVMLRTLIYSPIHSARIGVSADVSMVSG